NDLAADLKRYLNSEPILARPPSRLYEFRKTVRRHKVGFAATAAIVATLAVAATTSTWEAIRAKQAERREVGLRRQSRAESYTADLSVAKQAWDEGNLLRAQGLLDLHLPKQGEPDLRGFEWRYLKNLFQVKSLKTIDSFTNDTVKALTS